MTPNITIVEDGKIRIAAFTCNRLGKVSQKTIDMTPYEGRHVRIWLDHDGSYSLDPNKDHFWQVAELDVPVVGVNRTDTGVETLPLNLSGVEITTWELPE